MSGVFGKFSFYEIYILQAVLVARQGDSDLEVSIAIH